MRITAVFVTCVLVVMALSGCRAAAPPAASLEFAPIFQPPAPERSGLPTTSTARAVPARLTPAPTDAVEAGLVINVQARFLTATVDRLKQFDLVPAKDIQILSGAEFQKRYERAMAGMLELQTLIAPRLSLDPGHRAFVSVQDEQAYVQDLECLPRAGELPPGLKLVIGTIKQGTCIALRAHLKDDKVVFTLIEPVISRLLARRECSAKVMLGEELHTAEWAEPLLLLATGRLADPCEVSLGPDECLVLKMGYRLQQSAPAAVRMLAADGKIQERYVPQYGPPVLPGAAPAHVQHLLVLSARKVERDQAEQPGFPKVKLSAQSGPK